MKKLPPQNLALPTSKTGAGLSRRSLFKAGAASAVAVSAAACQGGRGDVADTGPNEPPPHLGEGKALFLSDTEMQALSALCDVFIPADIDAGAVQARCAQAINFLLSAFAFEPPMIFAGGPFSTRGGAEHNDFADFVPLDPYEETAWRLKIEGSKGIAALEFNGPAVGWQIIYRAGLAALDAQAAGYGFAQFADMPLATRELMLRGGGDADVEALVDVAFMHTLDAMYGAPEYGGNHELVGWGFTGYMGDVQPRGFTREQVEQPDNPGLLDLLGVKRGAGELPQAALLAVPSAEENQRINDAIYSLTALHSEELALGLVLNAQSSLRRVQTQVSQHVPKTKAGAR